MASVPQQNAPRNDQILHDLFVRLIEPSRELANLARSTRARRHVRLAASINFFLDDLLDVLMEEAAAEAQR